MHKVLKLGIAAAFESFGYLRFSIGASPQKLAVSTLRDIARTAKAVKIDVTPLNLAHWRWREVYRGAHTGSGLACRRGSELA